jgi:outer membrane scaffolding protein for murein synthesis (MipA/OmpV family)
MAKASLNLEHMKNEQVTIGTGAMVNDTDVLDGAAKDSPVFDASNSTVQYKTPAIPKDELGGRNNLNG